MPPTVDPLAMAANPSGANPDARVMAMRLVIAEEIFIRTLIANGRVTRWWFIVRYGPVPERDAEHSRPAEAAS